MKHILLCTDGSAFAQIGYEYAAWLAQRIDGAIEVLYVTDIRKQQALSNPDYSGTIGIDAHQELLDRLVDLERETATLQHARATIILDDAEERLRSHGIDRIVKTHRTGFLVDLFHEFESQADVIVMGKRGETAAFASEHLGANMERIVRSSHKPCLVTSRDFHPIRQVVLAYDGGKGCQKALDFMVSSPVFQDLTVHVITIAKMGRDKTQRENLEVAEMRLKASGFEPICHLLHGETENAIANYIETHPIDMMVMGAYGHSRIRHLVIGSTTAQMLRRCHLPVWLFR
ncbi:MAG: universal stress protein [Cyanobacteria bacterium SID2]|nr:universal stress protein [Cyanobacteria bacterium SID2]MBP0002149.1 universal stress protein [Cyanobacteria bacterium SBC]